MNHSGEKLPKKITTIYIFLMITVFLLYTGQNGYENILESKYQLFLIVCISYIAIMAIIIVEYALISGKKVPSLKNILQRLSLAQKLTIIYLGLTWISALTSVYMPQTIIGATRYEGALTISIYCIIFLLISAFGNVSEKMLYIFAISLFIYNCICIMQLYNYNPLNLYPNGYTYSDAYIEYSGEYLGTIGNVDSAAAFLCIAIPIVGIALLHVNRRGKCVLFISLITSIFVLIKMHVMAGFVGIFAALIAFMFYIFKKYQSKVFLEILILLLVVTVIVLFIFDSNVPLFHELHMVLHGNFDNSFGSGRIYIWRSVLERVPEHLFFGSGPDTMMYANIEPFSRYDQNLNMTIIANIDIAHNEYLNILYHQGLIAFVLYLGILINICLRCIRLEVNDVKVVALGIAAFSYCVQAFFGLSSCITTPFFWIALGLLECIMCKGGKLYENKISKS